MGDISLKGLRALVLEDEAVVALDLEEALLDLGIEEVVVAYSLADVDAGAAFDLVILDIALAGRSTLGFAASLSARGVPFVFATGRHDVARMLAGLAAAPTVGMPFSSAALAGAISQALRRPKDNPAD